LNNSSNPLHVHVYSGDLIKDGFTVNGKQKFKEERRVLITVGVRELELLMRKPKSERGFEGAWEVTKDGSRIARFSPNSLRTYWPNWLHEMSDADKVMCGCSTCLDTDDIVEAYNGKRRKIISTTEIEIEEMVSRVI